MAELRHYSRLREEVRPVTPHCLDARYVTDSFLPHSQVRIYYSLAGDALRSVAGPTSVNLAGGGQFQIGILKKPTGTSDVVNSGYQSKNLNEGQIYGGIFLEDSADGCVSL